MKRCLITLIALSALWPSVFAGAEPAPLALTVEEATLRALSTHPDLQVQRLTQEVNGAFVQIAQGVWDPEIFAELQGSRESVTEVARSTGQQFSVSGQSTSGVLGARKTFSTGTDVEVSVSHDYTDSTRTPTQQRARLGLSLTQALLRGGGSEVNVAQIRQAGLDVEISAHALRAYAGALVAEGEIAYWRYVLAARQIEIQRSALAVAGRARDDTLGAIEVGAAAPFDAATVKAEVARLELALATAEGALEDQRLVMARLIGVDLAQAIEAASDPQLDAAPVEDLADRLALADQSHPALQEARLRLAQRRLEVVMTRDGLRPRLDVFIGLGKSGFDETLTGAFSELSGPQYDLLAGVRLSQLVASEGPEGSHRAALLGEKQASLAIENLRREVALEVRRGANAVNQALRQIKVSATARALEEEKVKAAEARRSAGAGTALQLAQARRDLLTSAIAEIEALVAYRVARIQLELAEGTLLQRRGLQL